MQNINVTLDICGIAICLALLYPLLSRYKKNDKFKLYFIGMCIVNILMILGDIPAWLCEGFGQPWYPQILWIGSITFWLCSAPMLLLFTKYLIQYLSIKVTVNKYFWIFIVVLGAIHFIGSIVSIWNGMFFTISPQNTYQRGYLFWISQVIPFIIYGLNITIFIVYRNLLIRKDFIVLSSYISIPVIVLAIQALNFGIALLNAGVAFSLLLIYVNVQSEQELRFERKEKELAQARIDIMLSQIQPHFLHNTLITIGRICTKDPRQAKECIHQFSAFLRGNMQSLSSKEPILFQQELKHTQCFINLAKQRFGERLKVEYHIAAKDFYLPCLTLQPIVENAVQHGILKKEEGGTIQIITKEEQSQYIVLVIDDGIGEKALRDRNPSRHIQIGLQNVRERLKTLCGGTVTLEFFPGATTVTIIIPKERVV